MFLEFIKESFAKSYNVVFIKGTSIAIIDLINLNNIFNYLLRKWIYKNNWAIIVKKYNIIDDPTINE